CTVMVVAAVADASALRVTSWSNTRRRLRPFLATKANSESAKKSPGLASGKAPSQPWARRASWTSRSPDQAIASWALKPSAASWPPRDHSRAASWAALGQSGVALTLERFWLLWARAKTVGAVGWDNFAVGWAAYQFSTAS